MQSKLGIFGEKFNEASRKKGFPFAKGLHRNKSNKCPMSPLIRPTISIRRASVLKGIGWRPGDAVPPGHYMPKSTHCLTTRPSASASPTLTFQKYTPAGSRRPPGR
ncbi:MAG: hypothetical protein KIS77_19870 [Saprospiraceae bacterium]|nr:hypothetical protein [Saprospiraceae bacterium]